MVHSQFPVHSVIAVLLSTDSSQGLAAVTALGQLALLGGVLVNQLSTGGLHPAGLNRKKAVGDAT
jgi:hypothetical protein